PQISWQVLSLRGREALSQPFGFTLELWCDDPQADLTAVLGADCELLLERNGLERRVYGLIAEVELLFSAELQREHVEGVGARVEVVPALALLAHESDTRFFTGQSVPEIVAELLGFGTNCDGLHVTAPSEPGMQEAIRLSLADAGVSGDAIDYVNAHGTATELGDIAETQATRAVFGRAVPISSTKSYTGHTLGACGAIEAAYCLAMMHAGFMAPTRTLEEIDPACAELDYVRETRPAR
ncbi:MAG: hypothetical protein KC457_35495, partial [Myxococcales bacterium]|nr:hypothetical protein [Myxococcales bacterium]